MIHPPLRAVATACYLQNAAVIEKKDGFVFVQCTEKS